MQFKTYGAVVFLTAALLHGQVSAEIIAHEAFAYPNGATLDGEGTSGTGFSGSWRPSPFGASIYNDLQVDSNGLEFSGLGSSGGHAFGTSQEAISGLVRDFASPFGRANETVYMSFLARPESVSGEGTFNNFFGVTLETSSDDPELFIGRPGGSDAWSLERRGGQPRVASDISATVGRTDLLVLRADLTTSGDIFTLYVNPQVGAVEPTQQFQLTGLNLGEISGVGLYYTGGFAVDEIRVGRTFSSVAATAVPEPSLFVTVLSLGGAAVVWRRVRGKTV